MCMVFVGLLNARILLSLGEMLLFLLPVVFYPNKIATVLKNKITWIFSPFFFIHLLSYFNSDDKSLWWLFTKFSIPFLLLPIAFALWQKTNRNQFNRILFCFVMIALASSLAVTINYFIHYHEITQAILSGSSIPMPYSHIRYSLLLVFAFFSAVWLLFDRYNEIKYATIVLSIAACSLLIIIHLLAVRSGWIALYFGIFFLLGYVFFRFSNYKISLGILLITVVVAVLFYQFSTSIQNKIGYMRYDLNNFKEGKIDNHSDGVRIASMAVGWQLVKENPVFGVGTGDILQQSKTKYSTLFPTVTMDGSKKMPHNQWLWIAAATGIVGLILFLVTFLLPSVVYFQKATWLWWILQLIFFTSFMTEYTLEEQIGGSFFAIFSLLFINHFQYEKK